jgi:hypothetical protein
MQVKYKKAILTSIIAGMFLSAGISNSLAEPVQEPPSTLWVQNAPDMIDKKDNLEPIVFKHGDISWLPQLAEQAGWPRKTWKKLGQIILRESGGCPNRIGGSIVDKNCNITGHTGATNKSDSGLLQINGVNWDPKRSGRQLLCAEHKICKQEQLLDPVTNLAAGYVLYQKAGWDPWDPCAWGPEYAHRCKSSN